MKNLLNGVFVITLLLLNCIHLTGKNQDTLNVVLYKTSEDFRIRKRMDLDAILITDEIKKDYIMVSKLIRKDNMKKISDSKFIFALEAGGSYYVNMGYSDDHYYEDKFARLNVVGDKICTIANGSTGSNGTSAAVIGGAAGGALGSLVGSIIDSQKSIDYGFLYMDLTEKEYRNFSRKRNEGCLIKSMNMSSFKKLCKKYKIQVVEEPKIEDVNVAIDKINEL
jgi:hypothetical protein